MRSPKQPHLQRFLSNHNVFSFVHQNDEELNAIKKERRPGRPASTREDLLKIKIAADEKEYENGFCSSILYPGVFEVND